MTVTPQRFVAGSIVDVETFLNVSALEMADSGEYSCTVTAINSQQKQTSIEVNVYGKCIM